jgi:hypothetical protein
VALSSVLRILPQARVSFPSPAEVSASCAIMKQREPTLPDCYGFLDGTHCAIQSVTEHVTQNAFYNGWKSNTTICNVLLFGVDGTIIYAAYNFPGSWHDAAVCQSLYQKLINIPAAILADSAFPHSRAMAGKILCPLKETEREALKVIVD